MVNNQLKISLQMVCIAVFLLSFSIVIVILATPLYNLAISLFNIEQVTGLTRDVLMDNYQVLIRYLVNPFQTSLEMPDFPSSINGIAHFRDVKNLILIDLCAVFILGIVSIRIIQRIRKQKLQWIYLKPFQWMIIAPLIMALVSSVAFRELFLFFHKCIFTNTNWLFDPYYDPIILALPESYFRMCFLLIVVIFMVIATVCYQLLKNDTK